jgi:hypothetical protein
MDEKEGHSMNSQAIRELTQEAHEIINNIKTAAVMGEITWGQRDELLKIAYQDVNEKLTLAKNLLHDWTGIDFSEQ